MRVALDSMIFIYLFEDDNRYRHVIQPLFQRIEEGKIEAYTSIVSPVEVLSDQKLLGNLNNLTIFSNFFIKTAHLMVKLVDWEVAAKASELRRQYRPLKTPDALQLATGLVEQVDTFITNDDRLTHLKLPIKITPLSKYK